MLRTDNEAQLHLQLVNDLILMLDIAKEWQDKALNNKSLTEAMSFLFRNRKWNIYPTAASFEVGVHTHLANNQLSINPPADLKIKPNTLTPILNHFILNLFALHQSNAIDMKLGKLFAAYIDKTADREVLRQELKTHQSSPNLQIIVAGITPSITSLNQNLLRINDLLETVKAEKKARLKLAKEEALATLEERKRIKKEALALQLEAEAQAEKQKQAELRQQRLNALAAMQSSSESDAAETKSPASEISQQATSLPSIASATASLTATDSDESDFHSHSESEDEHSIDSTITTDEEEKVAPLSSTPKISHRERSPSYFLDVQLDHSDQDNEEDSLHESAIEGNILNEQKDAAEEAAHEMNASPLVADLSDLSEVNLAADADDLANEQQPVDEREAKLNALNACFNDLHWWAKMTSYKPLFGGTSLSVGDISKRVPHHISVFKNSINKVDVDAGINEMVEAATKQIPVINKGFSFGNLFKSKPGTRICGLFQVRQVPMTALIQTVANFKNLSLAELTTELKKIRGNTEWQPVAEVVVENRQGNRPR